MSDNPLDDLGVALNAAAGPMRRLSAITAQIPLSAIPVDLACYCLCSIYEPHTCDGWRADGLVRTVPAALLFGYQPPPIEVPVCRPCSKVKVRKS
jgi:hypothetical protein